jgi:hypothetical protein
MKFIEEIKLNNYLCVNGVTNGTINMSSILDVKRYYCLKNEAKIHLIIFYRRNNFYWFIELTNSMVYTGDYKLHSNETNFVSSFDEFNLTKCNINDIHWYLPNDLTYFMAQTKSSRFIPCDIKLAKEFRAKYRKQSRISDSFRIRIKNVINGLKNIMAKELKQFWILGGTLLGNSDNFRFVLLII